MLCNLLSTILRPNFEEPLDTAKQLVEKNIILYDLPGEEIWKQFLLDSSNPIYNKLGETMIMADDWDHYYSLIEHDVIGAGTHAYMIGYLQPWHLNEVNVDTKSNNVIILILIMTFKEFAKHLLHFQQV